MRSAAFTFKAKGRLRKIILPASVGLPTQPGTRSTPTHQVRALWDTGADVTMVAPEVVDQLGLPVIGKGSIQGVGSISDTTVHLLDLRVQNIVIQGQTALKAPRSPGEFDMIVGMDVITRGDFAVTSENGGTVVSFRMPSFSPIDFVQHDKANTEGRGEDRNKRVEIRHPRTGGTRTVKQKQLDRFFRDGWVLVDPDALS